MNLPDFKKISINGVEMKELRIGDTLIWKSGHTNLMPLSTEADGVTIYNGELGYKDECRVRSGGAETTDINATCTGYIACKKGDKLYIYPPFTGLNTTNAINFYDGDYNCLGQITDTGAGYGMCNSNNVGQFKTKVVNGVSVLDLSDNTASGVENIAFVRVTHHIYYNELLQSGSGLIITKNEEPSI